MSGNYTNIPGYGGANWKNPVATALDLPAINNFQGDLRVAIDTGVTYQWLGDAWIAASGSGPASDVNLQSVGGSPVSLGQDNMAGSIPVVIASDQTPLPISVSNTSVGVNGAAIPSSSTQVGGEDPSGDLQPFKVDSNGALLTTSSVSGTVISEQAGLDAFKTSKYTIGLTPIQITPTPLVNRKSVSIKVETTSSFKIFVAPDLLTLTNGEGWPMQSGDTLTLDITPLQTIYAVADGAAQLLYAIEAGG